VRTALHCSCAVKTNLCSQIKCGPGRGVGGLGRARPMTQVGQCRPSALSRLASCGQGLYGMLVLNTYGATKLCSPTLRSLHWPALASSRRPRRCLPHLVVGAPLELVVVVWHARTAVLRWTCSGLRQRSSE
jgi:hypothetical protein